MVALHIFMEIMLRLTLCFFMLYYILQVQTWDVVKEETALALYWLTDGVDRCWVGFVPPHLTKHMRKYDNVLAQITDVFCEAEQLQEAKSLQKPLLFEFDMWCNKWRTWNNGMHNKIKRKCNNFKQIHKKDKASIKKRSAET